MKKIEVYETFDGKRFDRANDAECYELACELAKAMTYPGFGNTQEDWKNQIPRALELVMNREKVFALAKRLCELEPSENFNPLASTRR